MKSLKPLTKKPLNSGGDTLIILLWLILLLCGNIFVYSASNYSALNTYGDKYYFLKKQIIGSILGIILFCFFAKINYYKLEKYKTVLLIISAVLLLLVFTKMGVNAYGAIRWIKIGGITIQPSEIAKFSYALFVASYFNKNPDRSKNFISVLPVILVGLLLCLLIMLEPNMSITVCVCILMFAMLFIAGVKLKHLLLLITPVLILAPVLIIIEPYRLKRLLAFINPWASPKGEGYQLLQSLYALGSGGFFGVGLFNSRQKYRFLPFAESDFILSIIGEETGFFGVAILFGIMFLLVYRGIKVASKTKDVYSMLLSSGITVIFCVQVCVNALVVTGTIPPTGLPLPLLSAGNTSIIMFSSAFGVLYNISKNVESY